MNDKDIIEKIKDWFDMYPPKYGGLEEWDNIRKENKVKYPIRYWISETLIPNTWWPISRRYKEMISYIRFGFFEKMHFIDTKLKPDYYDADTRLLHGMFSLLKDFVEIEKAWMEAIFNRDYKRPFWKLNDRFRNREYGIAYLDWEITLKDDPEEPNIPQAEAAQSIKDLYLWWVDIRPNRMDPYDLIPKEPLDKKAIYNIGNISDEKREAYKQINKLETDYYNEDTEMLKKLIDVRGSLWT